MSFENFTSNQIKNEDAGCAHKSLLSRTEMLETRERATISCQSHAYVDKFLNRFSKIKFLHVVQSKLNPLSAFSSCESPVSNQFRKFTPHLFLDHYFSCNKMFTRITEAFN